MDEGVRQFVEWCDRMLTVGTLMTDFNTGAFTSRLDPARRINVDHHHTEVTGHVFADVEMADVLAGLARRLPKRTVVHPAAPANPEVSNGNGDATITADALYPRWAQFIQDSDIVIAETGTSSMGLAFVRLPRGAAFHNQTLWGAIGWATPAALGAAVAAPDRRVVLVTGDGSHQLTAQEICRFGRLGLKPVIFLLNNNGYLIERLLCSDPAIAYNDVAQWNYAELPHTLGCDGWFTARVAPCAELDEALATAQESQSAVYIEVVTDTYAAPPLAKRLSASTATLYSA
jgi:indolepyruvate decarboxylase